MDRDLFRHFQGSRGGSVASSRNFSLHDYEQCIVIFNGGPTSTVQIPGVVPQTLRGGAWTLERRVLD